MIVALVSSWTAAMISRIESVERIAALGKLADLARDDREAPAGVAGPRRLDRRVERKQVRLLGDVVDQLEHLADLLAALAERQRALGDRLHLLLHVAHRVAGLVGGRGAGCALSAIDAAVALSSSIVAAASAIAADCSVVAEAESFAVTRISPAACASSPAMCRTSSIPWSCRSMPPAGRRCAEEPGDEAPAVERREGRRARECADEDAPETGVVRLDPGGGLARLFTAVAGDRARAARRPSPRP